MKLKQQDLYLLSQCAISAAYQAGRIISQHNALTVKVKNKKDAENNGTGIRVGDTLASQVVTEVDILCQQIILETLKPTFEIYDLALLAEESPDDGSRHQKDYFWCIDPLDGTLAFTRSEPGYSVSIALVSKEGIPQIGVIYDPYYNVLYHAVKEAGAFRNGKKWTVKQLPSKKNGHLNFVTDQSFSEHPKYQEVVQVLTGLAVNEGFKGIQIHFYGGAAMDACKVLELSPAVFFKLPKSEDGGGCIWDYAASASIYEETKCYISDIYGKPLNLNNPETPFMNQKGVMYASGAELARLVLNNLKPLIG